MPLFYILRVRDILLASQHTNNIINQVQKNAVDISFIFLVNGLIDTYVTLFYAHAIWQEIWANAHGTRESL